MLFRRALALGLLLAAAWLAGCAGRDSPPAPTATGEGVRLSPTATRTTAPTPRPAPTRTPLAERPAAPTLGDTRLRPADGMVMVYVPGGTFPMGSTPAEVDALLAGCGSACKRDLFTGESPQHPVTLDGFWMDRTEVTNAQFVAFMNVNGNQGPRGERYLELNRGYTRISLAGDRYETTEAAADHPVVMPTWYGAAAYCAWVGGRLPTEAEWEYAARGPEGYLYPWGNEPPTCDLANYGQCNRAPNAVGSRPAGASWCGVLDLAGNVWEWVANWYDRYPGAAQTNPAGPETGYLPVMRGGGWHSPAWEIRATYRQHDTPRTGYNG